MGAAKQVKSGSAVQKVPRGQGGEYLRALIEASDDAIIGLDIDGSITSWNKGAEKVFGYKTEEMLRQPVSILIPPARLAARGNSQIPALNM